MEFDECRYYFCYDGEDFTIDFKDNKLRGCKWCSNECLPQVVLIFVHDFGGFSTQNHDIFDTLTQHGAIIYACDHYGHGRSPGPRLGISIEDIIEETEIMIRFVRKQDHGLPILLYGQSYSSLALLKLIIMKENSLSKVISGVILESIWICQWNQIKVGLIETVLILLINYFNPLMTFDPKVTKLTSDVSPKFRNLCEKSSMYLPYMTPIFYTSAMNSITFVREKITDLHEIPIMLCMGDRDMLLNPSCLNKFRLFVEQSKDEKLLPSLVLKIYNGGHLISKESVRPFFIQDMLNFIQKVKTSSEKK